MVGGDGRWLGARQLGLQTSGGRDMLTSGESDEDESGHEAAPSP